MVVVDFLRAQFPLNRVVALLSPVLVGLGATVSVWLADHLPFIAEQVDQDELTGIFLASAAAGVAAVYQWLDGWKQHEALNAIAQPPLDEGAPETFDPNVVADTPPAGI